MRTFGKRTDADRLACRVGLRAGVLTARGRVVDLDHVIDEVHDPVLGNTGLCVEGLLDLAVSSQRRSGDLDDQESRVRTAGELDAWHDEQVGLRLGDVTRSEAQRGRTRRAYGAPGSVAQSASPSRRCGARRSGSLNDRPVEHSTFSSSKAPRSTRRSYSTRLSGRNAWGSIACKGSTSVKIA